MTGLAQVRLDVQKVRRDKINGCGRPSLARQRSASSSDDIAGFPGLSRSIQIAGKRAGDRGGGLTAMQARGVSPRGLLGSADQRRPTGAWNL